MMDAIRKVHDFLTVNAPTPLQEASAIALAFPRSYYQELAVEYRARRDRLVPALKEAGFRCFVPKGAYYVMADISKFGFSDDFAFARHLVENIGVACVPGSSFYHDPKDGRQLVRFTFCKKDETLDAAAKRLGKLRHAI
jgi:aspartate/methionine/tyrosine aminotransferase